MHLFRLTILLIALLGSAGCGSGDVADSDSSPKRGAGASTEPASTEAEQPEPRVTSTAFVETAAIRTCLERAGFAARATPAGGIRAWSGPQGTIVVASEPQLDRVIGAFANARVVPDTNLVISGDAAGLAAGVACLQTS